MQKRTLSKPITLKQWRQLLLDAGQVTRESLDAPPDHPF